MRTIDDLVDNYKSEHRFISEPERVQLMDDVHQWILRIHHDHLPAHQELSGAIRRFRVPSWPMELFARSMIYDVMNDGFPTLQSFIEYSQGATVAPASIFVHLCGLQKVDGEFREPVFDVKRIASPCAMFSYLVHIIRDFQKDYLNHLNYYSDELLVQYGLTREKLYQMAVGGSVTPDFRRMIGVYYCLAGKYLEETKNSIQEVYPFLEPRYRLSLEIIFNLYLMVYARIDIEEGNFTKEELNPTPAEIRSRVKEVIDCFNY
jgi:phytoene synthase